MIASYMQDEALHYNLNSLPPLEINKYVGATLNSLAMDSSPSTSSDEVLSSYLTLYHESVVHVRYL